MLLRTRWLTSALGGGVPMISAPVNNSVKFGALLASSPRQRGEPVTEAPGKQRRQSVSPHGWQGHGREKKVRPEDRWLDTEYYMAQTQGFSTYEPDSWLQTLQFKLDPFIFMPWFCLTGVVTAITFYIEVFNPGIKSSLTMPMDAHVVMGSALSFLVVFRTNSSYARWWEARCSWEAVISACRSHATSVASALRSEEATEQVFTLLIAYIISFKSKLRDEQTLRKELGPRMDWRLMRECNAAACPPLHALHKIQRIVRNNLPLDDDTTEGDESAINAAIFMESAELIRILVSAVATCERIKSTPMTYGYVATLRSFLVIWLGTLPLILIAEYGWIAPPALSLISFLFFTVEQMAIEIEQPFGYDANDLPIEEYILDLESTIFQLLPSSRLEFEDDDDDDDDGRDDDGSSFGHALTGASKRADAPRAPEPSVLAGYPVPKLARHLPRDGSAAVLPTASSETRTASSDGSQGSVSPAHVQTPSPPLARGSLEHASLPRPASALSLGSSFGSDGHCSLPRAATSTTPTAATSGGWGSGELGRLRQSPSPLSRATSPSRPLAGTANSSEIIARFNELSEDARRLLPSTASYLSQYGSEADGRLHLVGGGASNAGEAARYGA